jgi:uncharacterized protein (UPF0303 family)
MKNLHQKEESSLYIVIDITFIYPTLYYFLVTKLNKKNKTVAKEKEKNVGKEKFFFYT